MKIVFTLEEVKAIVQEAVGKQFGHRAGAVTLVNVAHDGSGESSVEDITRVDRVDVELLDGPGG